MSFLVKGHAAVLTLNWPSMASTIVPAFILFTYRTSRTVTPALYVAPDSTIIHTIGIYRVSCERKAEFERIMPSRE